MELLQSLWRWRSLLIFVLTPLVLLPLPLVLQSPEAYVAYMILLMAVYWVTEALPIGVTALIPVVLVPAFKILPSKDLCPAYFEDSNMLFIGGLMLAISVEFWDLHKRIALLVLQLVGVQPRWLLLGFLMPTWFMSMWISNTATSAMMLPIVDAVLHELMRHDQMRKRVDRQRLEQAQQEQPVEQEPEQGESGQKDQHEMIEMAENSETTEDKVEDSMPESVGEVEAPEASAATSAAAETNSAAATSEDAEETVLSYIQNPENRAFANICKMLTISVAYGANFGGTATLTGTAPNLVLNNNIISNFGNQSPFNFGTWFAYAFPISLVGVLIAWIWLQILYIGPRNSCKCGVKDSEEVEAVQQALKREYEKLGPITFPEVSCIILFIITIILWITREPGGVGWGYLFQETPVTYVNSSNGNLTRIEGSTKFFMADAQPAILMSILLFVFPSSNPFKRRRATVDVVIEETVTVNDDGTEEVKREVRNNLDKERPSTLLTWRVVHERLPWGIVLLLGGGFALAKATRESGLSALIGQQLKPLGSLPLPLLIVIVVYCTTFITEITSNTATASILLPILVDLSRTIGINPLSLMLPCTLAASFAFNLPVATPPNSIVFSKGYLSVTDMLKSGFVLTITSGLVLVAGTLSYGAVIFDFYNFPSWANASSNAAAATSAGFSAGGAVRPALMPRLMYVGNE
ncbi:hypothetical protein BOX15_Mlig023269g1 [Macrostomum lignano]|uniref:Uncharacterized protein n=1 Tax=Macrostomum lignano TaxID=282301 RepID=A0A267F7V5_9PLAT|nr:hypothetical protein BOX15_Mlig023269g1 [Macrostomum lignano]